MLYFVETSMEMRWNLLKSNLVIDDRFILKAVIGDYSIALLRGDLWVIRSLINKGNTAKIFTL